MRRPVLFLSAGALLFLSAPARVAAQAVTIDEGAFRISVGGTPVGREIFSIHRTAPGVAGQILVDARIELQDARGASSTRILLSTTATDLTLRQYQVRSSGSMVEEIDAVLSGPRVVATTRSTGGEREREFRATPQTVILDSGVAHHYYFLVQRVPTGGSIPVVAPRAGRQYDARVSELGMETLSIGGTEVAARRLRVDAAGETREVWVDREGRVLRVQDAASGYLAVREAAP